MQFSVLGSGSRGNCVFIESGNTAILIDGGFSGKEIALRLAAIGRTIDCLEGIFVTHEHHDHINGRRIIPRPLNIFRSRSSSRRSSRPAAISIRLRMDSISIRVVFLAMRSWRDSIWRARRRARASA